MARLQLQPLVGNTYYIPAPTNIGVYVHEQQAILIDSGNDAEAGRQILKLLTERGWTLRLIINTHSNADHIGGNAFLQAKTQCRIAATRGEAPFINAPLMEPAFLYGGFPLRDLRNKFILAEPSRVTDLIPSTGPILDTVLEAIPLPGHFVEMIGIRTPDDVVFLADSLFPETILHKYHVVFWYDLHAQFQTLERLATLAATQFIPSHGQPTTDLRAAIAANRQNIEELVALVLTACQSPASCEDVLAHVCRTYGIALNANQYVLVGSTLKSCLAYLEANGRLQINFAEGRMTWQARTGSIKP
jgi:glyoxylase-like metal-dependent hydrolase (beta-lactamase superfamily II)